MKQSRYRDENNHQWNLKIISTKLIAIINNLNAIITLELKSKYKIILFSHKIMKRLRLTSVNKSTQKKNMVNNINRVEPLIQLYSSEIKIGIQKYTPTQNL